MLVSMKTLPQGQDPRVVIEWIRACVWAGIEGWPFCPLTRPAAERRRTSIIVNRHA